MRAYRRRKALYAVLQCFFLVYFCCAAFLKQEPFPYFNWDLYSGNPHIVTTYEIMITSLDPEKELPKPVSLHDMSATFHRDWNPQPTKIIRRFGYLAERLKAANIPEHKRPAASIVETYYAPMQASKASVARARALVENYMLEMPYVQYDLVRLEFKPFDYLKHRRLLSYTVVGSYIKGVP
jgi:hypothetical protein